MRERALPFGYFRGIVGGADHWRAEVLNVSGNDALQAEYRGGSGDPIMGQGPIGRLSRLCLTFGSHILPG